MFSFYLSGNIRVVSIESLKELDEDLQLDEPCWLRKIRKLNGRRGSLKTYSKQEDPDDQIEDDDGEPDIKLPSDPVSESDLQNEEDEETYEIPDWACNPM